MRRNVRLKEEHTELFQHFVTLVQDEVLDVLQAEGLVPGERENTARRANDNVRAVLLQHLLILLDGQTAKKHRCLDGGHVLGEALVLFTDLESQLSCMAHD